MKKVAFVAGGALRTGRQLTLALAKAGFDLVIQHRDTPGPARATAREVEELGRRALVVDGDLTRESAVREMIRRADTLFGRLDVLVSCEVREGGVPGADGGLQPERPLLEELRGPYLLTRSAAPLLLATGGSVVHVLPAPGGEGLEGEALARLTREMARVLAPAVRVNAVAPARMPAPGPKPYPPITTGRGGNPGEVVRTVLFVLGSPHLTGEVVAAGDPGLP